MTSTQPTACDANCATAQPEGSTPHAGLVLTATILASSLAFVDGSVVNVALPSIGRDLAGAAPDLQWVVNAYLLPLSALLLLGGAAGDRYGRRRLLVAGIALFALASILCAAAPSLPWLLAGRAAQGIGAAMLMPNSLAILGSSFSGEARGRAIGTWAAAGAIAGAIGPLAGGWLVDLIGWRAIFFVNLPIAAGAIVLALRYVGESTDDGTPLDWTGGILATAALGALTWGLTLRSTGAGGGVVLVAGAVLLTAFVAVEWRRGDRAMMPVSLFTSRSFTGLTVLTLLLYGALGGLLLLLPYVLIEADHYSAFAAGAALLPLPVTIGIASRAMGRLAAKTGSRLPLTVGPIVVAGGFLLAARIGGGGTYWTEVFPALIVVSLGMAGAVAPLTTAVLSSVDARHTGTASGFNSAVARTGGMIATALLGAALAAKGDALVAAFQTAAFVAAALALGAGLAAFALLDRKKPA
ncbi:MFS transporter [Polymorphobacter sp. PAMC 29334]|uniref:MFS transporter n=1 Tax=Polymorphobacter sp. PAMC 29334 TaxID=2862331 RepID=UPI001C6781FD|nr:MFS transporter [Polymorphobacter sp. PAMC 29334]QYE35822.1 MFS transporter [Polymorphobacter sp. PAMC 29334]